MFYDLLITNKMKNPVRNHTRRVVKNILTKNKKGAKERQLRFDAKTEKRFEAKRAREERQRKEKERKRKEEQMTRNKLTDEARESERSIASRSILRLSPKEQQKVAEMGEYIEYLRDKEEKKTDKLFRKTKFVKGDAKTSDLDEDEADITGLSHEALHQSIFINDDENADPDDVWLKNALAEEVDADPEIEVEMGEIEQRIQSLNKFKNVLLELEVRFKRRLEGTTTFTIVAHLPRLAYIIQTGVDRFTEFITNITKLQTDLDQKSHNLRDKSYQKAIKQKYHNYRRVSDQLQVNMTKYWGFFMETVMRYLMEYARLIPELNDKRRYFTVLKSKIKIEMWKPYVEYMQQVLQGKQDKTSLNSLLDSVENKIRDRLRMSYDPQYRRKIRINRKIEERSAERERIRSSRGEAIKALAQAKRARKAAAE